MFVGIEDLPEVRNEIIMEICYQYELWQRKWEFHLFVAATEELMKRGLAGETYVNYVKRRDHENREDGWNVEKIRRTRL